AACAVSTDGKRDEMRRPSRRMTVRPVRSVSVANATSIVPRIGAFAPFGMMAIAARASSVFWSGQEITCGWYTVALPPSPVTVCGQVSSLGAPACSRVGVAAAFPTDAGVLADARDSIAASARRALPAIDQNRIRELRATLIRPSIPPAGFADTSFRHETPITSHCPLRVEHRDCLVGLPVNWPALPRAGKPPGSR